MSIIYIERRQMFASKMLYLCYGHDIHWLIRERERCAGGWGGGSKYSLLSQMPHRVNLNDAGARSSHALVDSGAPFSRRQTSSTPPPHYPELNPINMVRNVTILSKDLLITFLKALRPHARALCAALVVSGKSGGKPCGKAGEYFPLRC